MKNIAVIGLGNRGRMYARRLVSAGAKITALCEKNPVILEQMRVSLGVSAENAFTSDDEFFSKGKLADAIVIATQDRDHFGHAKQAVELGYDVLCEKPVSPVPEQCEELNALVTEKGVLFMVCHVLRYAPFYDSIKQVLDSGAIGEITNINHTENVGYWHFSHSYVRGNWRREDETAPSILAKCCHDLDLFYYFIGKPCLSVYSVGSRKLFLNENAPSDAPAYCLDGCPHAKDCPYYAPKLYYKVTLTSFPRLLNRKTLITGNCKASFKEYKEALRTSPYGRCVYRCDNDVMENQTVACHFEGNVNATLTMTANSKRCFRRIHITGTKGELFGADADGYFTLNVFGKPSKRIKAHSGVGHLGGDAGIVKDFLTLLETGKPTARLSLLSETMESHKMAFGAETSRKNNEVVNLKK